jgi:hypothetical protein
VEDSCGVLSVHMFSILGHIAGKLTVSTANASGGFRSVT